VKIYRTAFHDADEGTILSWHSSRREAEKALRELQAGRDRPQGVEEVEQVILPTDRAGMLRWLNARFDRDNG
jgi:hypothetical protein